MRKTIQIIPADSWAAIYKDSSGEEFSSPLIAWALLSDGEIVGMEPSEGGHIDEPKLCSNFIRYERKQ